MAHYRRATARACQNPAMDIRLPASAFLLLLALLCATTAQARSAPDRVLVFSKTAEFRHDAIPVAVAALQRVAAHENLLADHSEDADDFTPGNLARYRVVVFASTTGDVLDEAQQQALEGFIRNGGGFVGVHAAADTEYDWPWYGQLVGAYFRSHPPGLQSTHVQAEHDGRPVGARWAVTDELYNYRENPRTRVQVIATVDEREYEGGTMGADHPIAWCHAFDGGRSWYTGLGHDPRVYAMEPVLAQLQRGLRYAAGRSDDC
jgi:type 1 glutamine amidotransferase